MMIVTTWTRVWCCIRSFKMTTWVALVLGRIRQACHYGSLVIRDNRRIRTICKGLVTTTELLEDCVDFFK